MEGINKRYNLEIEVLTPLSIGAAAEKDWVRGIDFVVEDGKLYKLNLKKILLQGISPEVISSLFASKDEQGLKAKLTGKLEKVSDFAIPLPAQSDNDVKTFVKNQLTGLPVLTGSSLKGAIRSVLFQHLRGKTRDGKEVFGSAKEGDEFMRFIKLSDTDFDGTSLVNTKIFNLRKPDNEWLGGWKHDFSSTGRQFSHTGFNTLYECLMPRQKGLATIMMSETVYDRFESSEKPHFKTGSKRPILHDDVSTLFGIINKHTKDYLLKEKAFFLKYPTDKSGEIVDSIDSLLNQIPSDNSFCLLKMSAGSGFHSITGDWQFDDYSKAPFDRKRNRDGKVNPKSRKIAIWDDNFSLMGFIKLRNVDDDELALIEKRRAEAAALKLQEEKAKVEEERMRAEVVERERQEQEHRRQEFNGRINDVERLSANEQYEEALRLYKETLELYPGLSQNTIDAEWLQIKVDMIAQTRKKEELRRREEAVREQVKKDKAEGGLAKQLDEKYEFGPNAGSYKVSTFKVCQSKVSSWLKAAKATTVPPDQYDSLFVTLKRLASNPDKKEAKAWNDINGSIWKTVSKWVGEKTVETWLKELPKNT